MKNLNLRNIQENLSLPKILQNKGELIFRIESKLLLEDNKNGIYNKLYIIENKGKIYAYNPFGKKVFLPKEGIYTTDDEYFYFVIEDDKILLYIEYPGVGIYYDENGERYTPKSKTEKINQKVDKILQPIGEKVEKTLKPVIETLINTLQLETIFPQEGIVKIPKRPENKEKTHR